MRNFHKVNHRGLYIQYNEIDNYNVEVEWNTFSCAPVSNADRTMPREEEIYGIDYLRK